jgi:cobalt-zinc-cadmium efflux system outer membrane protein
MEAFMRKTIVGVFTGVCLLAMAAASYAQTRERNAKKRAPSTASLLARDLPRALAIDAETISLEARRGAEAARGITASSTFAGSPYVAASSRVSTRGPSQQREVETEVGAPLWLPGQRARLSQTVTAGIGFVDASLRLRQLVVAGHIREAYWSVQRARADIRLARTRMATAQDIFRDIQRRSELGDIAEQDTLIARNEIIAAEAELAQAVAAEQAARAQYSLLTGGGMPDGAIEGRSVTAPPDLHPALGHALAAVARSDAELRLVLAARIDNPELAVFGRTESGAQNPVSNTVGVRLRMPLPTEGRNAPRRAAAEAERIKAEGELALARRQVVSAVKAAELALQAARKLESIAARRLTVADQQYAVGLRAYQLGEISLFDLYRIRQIQLEAARARAVSGVELGLAQSRLQQARGQVPI